MHRPATARPDLAQTAAAVRERLRARAPRVHCITNNVAQNFTANALLAVGCVPSMTLSSAEIGAFVAGADALLVNLGTFDAERRAATEIAVKAAIDNVLPWVLDPVFVDRAPGRNEFARELIGRTPTVVRLNEAEFAALAGREPSPDALKTAAGDNGIVIALSGAADFVTDGTRVATIANGHALMAKVTAMGCAGSALLAACLAVEDDEFQAAAAGLILLGVAGEVAAEQARGPGSFAAAILDALYNLDDATLVARVRVT
ncbi:MAG: hydroxyethylthiazole kinase [Pseudolabrys sp.]